MPSSYPSRYHSRRAGRLSGAVGLALLALTAGRLSAAPAAGTFALPGHIPPAVAGARAVSALSASRLVPLALTLPLRNQAALGDLLHRLYDKNDPFYGQYLTPAQFTARFGPTQADYSRVMAFARAAGLTITGTHPNRTLLDVSGTAAQVERAFRVRLNIYRSWQNGRYFYAPNSNPILPPFLAGVVSGVVGLDNAALRYPQYHVPTSVSPFAVPGLGDYELPLETGSGMGGGLTPSDIKTAYNLSGVTQDGTGQTLGLFELDAYTTSDITAYETAYTLPAVPLVNIPVDGGVPTPGGGAVEVTLDIELQIALAPQASRILVYEAPNSDAGVIDAYNKIATDDLATETSTSWGLAENYASPSVRNSENAAFQQMAAQGQSIFAAAGDSGAYDDGQTLSVDDPASQPFMVGVGGTALATTTPGGAYKSETTWRAPYDTSRSPSGAGGGGGISTVSSIPPYQVGVAGSRASQGSTTMRNVPDVSLDADPNASGYDINYGGGVYIVGGTSCAAPLWAAFTALVNQQRAANSQTPLGFANPPIYAIGTSSHYGADFHDIADGSTNLYYPAVTGYDDATGWGSFNGASLLADLSTPPAPPAPQRLQARDGNAQVSLNWSGSVNAESYNLYRSTTPGGEGSTPYRTGLTSTSYTDTGVVNGGTYYYTVTAVDGAGQSGPSNEATARPQLPVQLLSNTGFENGSSRPAPWTTSPGVIDNSASEPAHGGSWKAWLDGYGFAHTDTLSTPITIPATGNTATLTFYLHVDTAERSRTTAYDTLKVQVRDGSSGALLSTAATYSNINAAPGYVQESVDLSAYVGRTVQISLVGKEDSSLQTSFVVDDFALNVQ